MQKCVIYSVMNCIDEIKQFKSIPFTHSVLLSLLDGYKRPNDKISRLISGGDIIKVKKGLYVLSSAHRQTPVSQFLLANLMYGPSYVSLDSALSYHGLIPEGVFELCSVTPKRAKRYKTPLGCFSYTHTHESLYGIGIDSGTNDDGSCFLIASAEKALCDKIIFTKNLAVTSVAAMRLFLIEDLRIDLDDLAPFDLSVIAKCCDCGYKERQLNALYKVVEAEV